MMTSIRVVILALGLAFFAILSIPKKYFMLKAVEYKRDADWAMDFHSPGTTSHDCALLKSEIGKSFIAIAEALPGIAEEEK